MKESERLRREEDKFKFIYLIFERWQFAGFRKGRQKKWTWNWVSTRITPFAFLISPISLVFAMASVMVIVNMALRSKVTSVFRPDLFSGKVAVVTGGGTGIGRAITEELVHLGCKVVIASRKAERLQSAADEINATVASQSEAKPNDSPVLPLKCNTRNEAEVNYINSIKLIEVFLFYDTSPGQSARNKYSRMGSVICHQ